MHLGPGGGHNSTTLPRDVERLGNLRNGSDAGSPNERRADGHVSTRILHHHFVRIASEAGRGYRFSKYRVEVQFASVYMEEDDPTAAYCQNVFSALIKC